MCSAAWTFHESGYEFGFNRDEKWTRPHSADPALETDHSVAGACARDAGAGGTWLFTNEFGVTLAVMNAYPGGKIPPPGKRSRGRIPLVAGDAETPEGIERRLMHLEWDNYAPCHILLISPKGSLHYCWDGIDFRSIGVPPRHFFTTSSVKSKCVEFSRISRFEELANSTISEILRDTVAADPASAIFLTREDAGTVSLTSVKVDLSEIRFVVTRRDGESHEIIFPRRG